MDPNSSAVQSILRRVDADIQSGDYKSAESRLSSFMRCKGYDAELMARLGRIAYDMHDPFAAGKYWLVSTAEGPEVEAAIEAFYQRCGRDPHQVASQIPGYARLKNPEEYPRAVQDRLRNLSIREAIARKAEQAGTSNAIVGWKDRVFMYGCVTALLIGGFATIVGLLQIVEWFR